MNLPLRLQGPLSANGTGRVEVFYDGQWGTICDDGWDLRDARVACRQLGYADAVIDLDGSQVPPGSGRIWLDNVACTGKEKDITACSINGLGNADCSHSEDAGVECSRTGKARVGTFAMQYDSGVSCKNASCLVTHFQVVRKTPNFQFNFIFNMVIFRIFYAYGLRPIA